MAVKTERESDNDLCQKYQNHTFDNELLFGAPNPVTMFTKANTYLKCISQGGLQQR